MIRRVAVIATAILILVLGACRGGNDEATEGSAGKPETTTDLAAPASDADAGKAERSSAGSGGDGGNGDGAGGAGGAGGYAGARTLAVAPEEAAAPDIAPVPQGGPTATSKVIKNISLDVEVEEDSFQRQFARAGTVAEQFGGFVTNSQVSETDGELSSGSLTIRVPSDRFEQAVARLKALGEVKGEDRSGQDVSKQFVDLEARLRQAKTEEGFYLRLMDEAEGISDMIQIQSQLSAVQLKIESIQGELNFLKDQTDFSTITVRVYEPGAPTGAPKGLARAWEGAVDGFQQVVGGLVVAVGWLAPFVLLGLAGLFVLKVRSRSRVAPAPEAPPASS